jgi:predicted outer membrane protein
VTASRHHDTDLHDSPENARMHSRPLSFLLACLAVTACRAEHEGAGRGDTSVLVHGDTANATSLSAPQVVTLVSALNGSEIGAAQGALPKLGNKLTQAFAQAMVKEHGAMDSTIKSLPAHGEPMPVPPPQVSTMQAASKAQGGLLGAMVPGKEFDRAYIASQVANHQMALDSITRWRQVVNDAALAAVLDQGETKVRAHLASGPRHPVRARRGHDGPDAVAGAAQEAGRAEAGRHARRAEARHDGEQRAEEAIGFAGRPLIPETQRNAEDRRGAQRSAEEAF